MILTCLLNDPLCLIFVSASSYSRILASELILANQRIVEVLDRLGKLTRSCQSQVVPPFAPSHTQSLIPMLYIRQYCSRIWSPASFYFLVLLSSLLHSDAPVFGVRSVIGRLTSAPSSRPPPHTRRPLSPPPPHSIHPLPLLLATLHPRPHH